MIKNIKRKILLFPLLYFRLKRCISKLNLHFPKGTSFDNIIEEQIVAVEYFFNNRPGKCLNFLTHMKVFNSAVAIVT